MDMSAKNRLFQTSISRKRTFFRYRIVSLVVLPGQLSQPLSSHDCLSLSETLSLPEEQIYSCTLTSCGIMSCLLDLPSIYENEMQPQNPMVASQFRPTYSPTPEHKQRMLLHPVIPSWLAPLLFWPIPLLKSNC